LAINLIVSSFDETKMIVSSFDETKTIVSAKDEPKSIVSAKDETKSIVSSKDESIFFFSAIRSVPPASILYNGQTCKYQGLIYNLDAWLVH
jgi:hypothetical protein